MVPLFDFFIVTFEYFLFLLEPLVGKIARRFNLETNRMRNNYCRDRPWLLKGPRQQVPRSLDGLEYEIGAVNQRAHLEKKLLVSEGGLDFFKLIRDQVSIKQLSYHIAPLDPVDYQLIDWLDYDVGLAADWDLPELEQKLGEIFNDIGRVKSIKTDSPATGSPSCNFMLQLTLTDKQQQQQQQQQQSVALRWLSIDQFRLVNIRSSLIFFYTQQHCEHLIPLFNSIVILLDVAGLIESSQLADRWYCQRFRAAAPIDEPKLLNRYTLILMLVAYLDSPEAAQAKVNKNPLANLMIGFCKTYKPREDGDRIRIQPNRAGGFGRLEMVWEKGEARGKQLLVLEPIVGEENATKMKNVAQDIPEEVVDEIRGLLGRLAELFAGKSVELTEESFLESMMKICSKSKATVACSNNTNLSSIWRVEQKAERPDWGSISSRLAPSRILKNLLILLVILALRAALINYLESLKRDLKDQARDDLVQLKHSIFETTDDEDSGFFNQRDFLATVEPTDGWQLAGAPASTEQIIYDEVIGENEEAAVEESSEDVKGDGKDEAQETRELLNELTNILLMRALGGGAGDSLNGGSDMEHLMRMLAAEVDSGDSSDRESLAELGELFAAMGSAGGPSEQPAGGPEESADPMSGDVSGHYKGAARAGEL